MFLNPEALPRVLPESNPPLEAIPEVTRILAASLSYRPQLLRTYLWASALLNAGFQSAIPVPRRFSQVSAGFISLNEQVARRVFKSDANGIAFGLQIVAAGRNGEQQTVDAITVGGVTFPVLIVYGRTELHGGPPDPSNASSTCWVRNLGGVSSWQYGILTCRHAVSTLSVGQTVALVASTHHGNPSSSVLADIDECTLDAAVLEISSSDWPSGLAPLTVAKAVAPMQPVQFEDRQGVIQNGHVAQIFNYPTYIGNLFGQRVIADCKGVAGDSGSLLLDPTTNEAVGIYMGTIPDGAGGHNGIFQDMSQIESYFQLALHN